MFNSRCLGQTSQFKPKLGVDIANRPPSFAVAMAAAEPLQLGVCLTDRRYRFHQPASLGLVEGGEIFSNPDNLAIAGLRRFPVGRYAGDSGGAGQILALSSRFRPPFSPFPFASLFVVPVTFCCTYADGNIVKVMKATVPSFLGFPRRGLASRVSIVRVLVDR